MKDRRDREAGWGGAAGGVKQQTKNRVGVLKIFNAKDWEERENREVSES